MTAHKRQEGEREREREREREKQTDRQTDRKRETEICTKIKVTGKIAIELRFQNAIKLTSNCRDSSWGRAIPSILSVTNRIVSV